MNIVCVVVSLGVLKAFLVREQGVRRGPLEGPPDFFFYISLAHITAAARHIATACARLVPLGRQAASTDCGSVSCSLALCCARRGVCFCFTWESQNLFSEIKITASGHKSSGAIRRCEKHTHSRKKGTDRRSTPAFVCTCIRVYIGFVRLKIMFFFKRLTARGQRLCGRARSREKWKRYRPTLLLKLKVADKAPMIAMACAVLTVDLSGWPRATSLRQCAR